MKDNIRELFIKEFVRNLIKHTQIGEVEKVYPQITQQPQTIISQTFPQDYSMQRTGNAIQEIKNLVRNPEISSIECPGPDKELIITHRGLIQPIGTKLSKSEIDRMLKEFSKKTRIPLIPGVFKAILGNLVITAVVSDYIGTRFILYKH